MRPSRFALASALCGSLAGILLGAPSLARACGCFTMSAPTPGNPPVPVVQAGEQLVFAVKDGVTTAHIRVQYQGKADDFGWLLPLPSVPTLELGIDELFTQILAATAPVFAPTVTYDQGCPGFAASGGSVGGCGSTSFTATPGAEASADFGAAPPRGPLVVAGSLGPYDYAVLKADDKQAMLDWLAQNRYSVPPGSDAAITPYIHPGGYFLALRLRAGETVGNIVPVVVHYASDLPMIPIVLTQASSTPTLPIEVFLLGSARAVPRNYAHVVLDDAALSWNAYGTPFDYQSTATAAVAEAPKKHGFITEYAGPASILRGVLDAPGRFGDAASLRTVTDPVQYVAQLRSRGFVFDGQLYGILEQFIPEPPTIVAAGVSLNDFYSNLPYWLNLAATTPIVDGGPQDGGAWDDEHFNAGALTDELWMRVVTPTLTAARLFTDYPVLTRLFTALAPADMTEDPVFQWNPDLPGVPLQRTAQLVYHCSGDATLTLPDGFTVEMVAGQRTQAKLPSALRIEATGETGAPTAILDNTAAVKSALSTANQAARTTEGARGSTGGGGGCALVAPRGFGGLPMLGALGLLALALRSRRRIAHRRRVG